MAPALFKSQSVMPAAVLPHPQSAILPFPPTAFLPHPPTSHTEIRFFSHDFKDFNGHPHFAAVPATGGRTVAALPMPPTATNLELLAAGLKRKRAGGDKAQGRASKVAARGH